ncbi:hypothetical protein [Streptomyces sp. UNOC14_S4]|uniref:hypothetical protein n=1 Tax=Streptomyces sp. UNOC14_S4 TaxID=2872340 RepID=UPI001E2C75B4|nr:hypothetical protein [Streptomyces sp. UNOC14_S4]MCC3770923.1 hypothetical protein [Streptomyces sp. UNOC14_S4]
MPTQPSVTEALEALPQVAPGTRFGPDIDTAHEGMFAPGAGREEREAVLWAWLDGAEPCSFGRFVERIESGANAAKPGSVDLCWIGEDDLARGHEHLAAKVWTARAAWKRRAIAGECSAFLIVFTHPRLAYARPGRRLGELCLALAGVYLSECAPVEYDTVYAEALPLRRANGGTALFKAGTRMLFTGAHGGPHHERRMPGGVAISVNSPGHYAASLAERGQEPRPGAAAVPYRVGVLVPGAYGQGAGPRSASEGLRLGCLTPREFSVSDPEHGWASGLPIGDDAMLTNPWEPVGSR